MYVCCARAAALSMIPTTTWRCQGRSAKCSPRWPAALDGTVDPRADAECVALLDLVVCQVDKISRMMA